MSYLIYPMFIPESSDRVWLEYAYHKLHPVLQYLTTKLTEWIGENMQNELGFPDKQNSCQVYPS